MKVIAGFAFGCAFFLKQRTSAAFGKYEADQKTHSANLLLISADFYWMTGLDCAYHCSTIKFSTGLHQIWIWFKNKPHQNNKAAFPSHVWCYLGYPNAFLCEVSLFLPICSHLWTLSGVFLHYFCSSCLGFSLFIKESIVFLGLVC